MDKTILKIAGHVFENHCKYTESEIRDNLKITKKDFDRFTIAFSPKFATHVDNRWHLSADGVQLYFNLKQQNQQAEWNKWITVAAIMGGILSAIEILKILKFDVIIDNII